MTPDSTWANWFVTYFHMVDPSGAYSGALADLDPIAQLAEVRVPLLLQFGTSDAYVSSGVTNAMHDAAPAGSTLETYAVGHRLDGAARAERDAWLGDQLGVAT